MTLLRLRFRPFAPACAAGTGQRQVVTCRGPGFGGNSPGGQPNRLYIPGSDSSGAQRPGKLILPSQQGGPPAPGQLGQQRAQGQPTDAPPPAFGNFRPPPGFMDAVGKPQEQDLGLSPDEMLNRLRAGSGYWHQLAKFLPALQRAGYDSMLVEEMVGMERSLQNVWTAAEQVYESVKKAGELPPELLAHFDNEGGEHLLYELRLLSIKQRCQAADYIARNELSPPEALVLARAIKDHERRDGSKEGFSSAPGDCLAYKYYRDAIECRKKEDAEVCVQKGLSVVVTESARAKLASMLGEQEAAVAARPTATLTTLRLTKDELGSRVVCVAGSLQECSAATMAAAPKASAEGVFGNFRVPNAELEWVALPNWSLLNMAGHPVALSISNCADLPEVRAATLAKTDDDIKKLTGSGLLVLDLASGSSSVTSENFYLVEGENGTVQLREGGAVGQARVLGVVLFLCRSPPRDGGLAGSTSELLSL